MSSICARSCRCGWKKFFQIIASDLEQAGLTDYLRAGVFLCGGGARAPQIAKLAEPILGMQVSLGQTNSVSGLKSALDQPEFCHRDRPRKIWFVKNPQA